MTKISSFFSRSRELILVDAKVVGRSGRTTLARLVIDTGSAATTLTPSVVKRIGYSRTDAYKDVVTPNFAVTVFPLGHQNLDGLVGMNFLRHFNFEIRSADQTIHLELIEP